MVILVVSKYMDGEIRSIEGYATEERVANKRVEELNNTVAPSDSYHYTTEIVDKIL
jgi:hypothetical protein